MKSDTGRERAMELCERAGIDTSECYEVTLETDGILVFSMYVRNDDGCIEMHYCHREACGGDWPFPCPLNDAVKTELITVYFVGGMY